VFAIPESGIPGSRPFYNNNNNNLTCKAPVCAKRKTSVALPIPNLGIGRRLNPEISGLQKYVKNVLFEVLNDTNNNSSPLMNKIFDAH